MGKGGGGGGSAPQYTGSTVTQQNLPEYAEPYYRDLLTRTGFETAVPYQTYQGPRLEYFTPAEQEAMSRIQQLGVSGTTPELTRAGQTVSTLTEFGTGPEAAGLIDPGSLSDAETLQSYMSPYMQAVVDTRKREATRQADIASQDLSLAAAGQGSLGGYREAIQQAELDRNLMQQLDDIQATGSQAAYEQAVAGFEADRAARQSAYDRLMTGAGTLGDFASQRQLEELSRLNALREAGAQERALLQAGLDIGYQDFIRQQAFPREQLAFYSQMLQGTPIAPGTVQAQYGSGPTTAQQMLGTGIGAVGLYNALGLGGGS